MARLSGVANQFVDNPALFNSFGRSEVDDVRRKIVRTDRLQSALQKPSGYLHN
jgi:hypothetical protein